MFQYRQVLVRMRQGDTDRDIARARLMGRRKCALLRELASARGWLDTSTALPEDEAIAKLELAAADAKAELDKALRALQEFETGKVSEARSE